MALQEPCAPELHKINVKPFFSHLRMSVAIVSVDMDGSQARCSRRHAASNVALFEPTSMGFYGDIIYVINICDAQR